MKPGIRNPVLRFLVYSHTWLALGAAAQVLWMSVFFVGADRSLPVVLAASSTFAGYGCMRIFRMNAMGIHLSEHMTWFRENIKAMLISIATCGAIAVYSLAVLWSRFDMAFWIACACAVLYVLPNFGGRQVWGLRRIPLLKSLLIAYAWAAMTVFVARAADEAPYVTDISYLLVVVQFFFFLAVAIVFDIRDAAFDLPSIRSVPQVIGGERTRALAVLLMMVPISMYLAMFYFSNFVRIDPDTPDLPCDWTYLFAGLGYTLAAILLGRRPSSNAAVYHGLVLDGLLIFIPLLAWVGSLI